MATGTTSTPPLQIETKPGYKTTEFWQSTRTHLVTAVVAIIGMFRAQPGGHTEQWSSTLNQVVPVVAALLAAFGVNRQYVASRTEVKTTTAQANATIAQAWPVT